MQDRKLPICPSRSDRNLRGAGIAYLCTGAAFLGAAFLAGRVAFTGVGFAFVGLGIAFIARGRRER